METDNILFENYSEGKNNSRLENLKYIIFKFENDFVNEDNFERFFRLAMMLFDNDIIFNIKEKIKLAKIIDNYLDNNNYSLGEKELSAFDNHINILLKIEKESELMDRQLGINKGLTALKYVGVGLALFFAFVYVLDLFF